MYKTHEIVGIFSKLQRPVKRIGMSNNITLETLKERKYNKTAMSRIFSSEAKLDELVF